MDFDNLTDMNLSYPLINDGSPSYNCSGATKEELLYFQDISHYIDGVAQLVLCIIGLTGNSIAMPILCSKNLDSVFYRLLVYLAISDNLYLICALLESLRSHLHVPWDLSTHTILYAQVIYPIHNIVLCCSIYITAAIAFERYMAVCKPVVYHNYMTNNNQSSWFRTLVYYMIPVTFFCIIINIPKFFELEIESYYGMDGVRQVAMKPSKLRLDQTYVIYYHHYTRLFVTCLIPFCSLAFCNFSIYKSVKQRRKFAKNSESENENRQAILLVLIVFLFLLFNTLRIFLTLKEAFSFKQFKEDYLNGCQGLSLWMLLTGSISHFFLSFNSSINFFLYCVMSSAFREVLGSHCKFMSKLSNLCVSWKPSGSEMEMERVQPVQNTHIGQTGVLMTSL